MKPCLREEKRGSLGIRHGVELAERLPSIHRAQPAPHKTRCGSTRLPSQQETHIQDQSQLVSGQPEQCKAVSKKEMHYLLFLGAGHPAEFYMPVVPFSPSCRLGSVLFPTFSFGDRLGDTYSGHRANESMWIEAQQPLSAQHKFRKIRPAAGLSYSRAQHV